MHTLNNGNESVITGIAWLTWTNAKSSLSYHNSLQNSGEAYNIWVATWGYIPTDICARRRLKSTCASAQSYQTLRCPHEETLHPWLSKMHAVKILIRLRECAGLSESLLGAHVRSYVSFLMLRLISLTEWQIVQILNKLLVFCIYPADQNGWFFKTCIFWKGVYNLFPLGAKFFPSILDPFCCAGSRKSGTRSGVRKLKPSSTVLVIDHEIISTVILPMSRLSR